MKINLDAKDLMKRAVEFHGHACPGVALGVLVSKYILEHGNDFSVDEEIVAVVENDNCSVDAIQALIGATFGKGNLIFLDYGKNNYTFYNRTNKKAIKFSLELRDFGDKELTKEERIVKLLSSNPKKIFKIEKVEFNPPQRAQIHQSIICDRCGEPAMSTKIKKFKNKRYCIPCSEKVMKNLF